MTDSSPPSPPRFRNQPWVLWNPDHRRTLVLLAWLMLGFIAWRTINNPLHVEDPTPLSMPRSHELADRIDPNTADLATLSALPLIGPRRAQDLIDHRTRRLTEQPEAPAFSSPEDLMRVRGIGPGIVNHLRPYLIFPGEPAGLPGSDQQLTPSH